MRTSTFIQWCGHTPPCAHVPSCVRRGLRLAWLGVVGAILVVGMAAGPAVAAPPSAMGLLTTVKLGSSPLSSSPQAVTVDPTTDTVYVAGWDPTGAGVVWALNGATGQPVGGPVTVGPPSEDGEGPNAIAVDPSTHLVYVTNPVNSSLSIIDGADLAAPPLTVSLSGQVADDVLDNIVVDPTSDTVYVDAGTGIDVLDGRTGKPERAPLDPTDEFGPLGPFGPLALDASNDTIYAGENLAHGGVAWAINLNTGTAQALNDYQSLSALYLALDPATQELYDATGQLDVFSPAANKFVSRTSLDPGYDPGGLVVDPTSDTVYLLDATNKKLWALDGTDPSTSDPSVKVGQPGPSLADGLAFDAATSDLYVTNPTLGTLSIVVPHATYVPAAPSALSASAEQDAASVRFVPPRSDGGSPITSYTVAAIDHTNPPDGGQTATITAETVAESGLAITITGLFAGDSYTFTVTASNAVGTGPASAPSNAVTPTTPTPKGGGGGGCTGSKCQ
jgi:DNA-binding beta-propeller fold protein YncE